MLILPVSFRSQLMAAAAAAMPQECCGLLEGVWEGDAIRVTAHHPATNLAAEPLSGFEIDPAVHLQLLRTLRGSGRAIIGCYHSHPNGRQEPSARDRANGCEEGFVWLIIVPGGEIRAFEGPRFDPLVLGET